MRCDLSLSIHSSAFIHSSLHCKLFEMISHSMILAIVHGEIKFFSIENKLLVKILNSMDFGLWPGYTRINLLKVANGSQCLVPHCVIKTTFSTMQIRLVEVCVIHPQCCLNLLASCHVCPSSLLIGVFIQPRPIFCHSLGCVEVELWYVLTYFHHVFYRTAQKGTLFISFLMFIEK